jgi:hypothetical protein
MDGPVVGPKESRTSKHVTEKSYQDPEGITLFDAIS